MRGCGRFQGIYFMTQDKKGVSAMKLHRQLGISYNAAWRMRHKRLARRHSTLPAAAAPPRQESPPGRSVSPGTQVLSDGLACLY